METLRIRWAVDSDLDRLLEFEQDLIRAERPMDPTIRPDPVNYYDLPEMIRNPEVALVVAVLGETVVGCGYARAREARPYLNHEKYAYLGFMYTVPDFRGRGVNRKIITYLSGWARENGLQEIRLTVYQTNEAAIRAYEKAGFRKHLLEMRL